MSNSIDENGVITTTGDGFGVNWGRKLLVEAPNTAVKMQFAYRAYFTDAPTAVEYLTGQAWDPRSFFGIGFDDEEHTMGAISGDTLSAPSSFLGLIASGQPRISSGSHTNTGKVFGYYDNSSFGGGKWAAPWCGALFPYASLGDVIPHQAVSFSGAHARLFNNTYGFDRDDNTAALTGFPPDATEGQMCTFMWEVWGSAIDKSVYCRLVKDRGSIAEGDGMFDAFDGKSEGNGVGDYRQYTVHGDITSNWRNQDDTMNFPRWIKFKYAYPQYSLRLKYWKVRYLDAADTVVREQAIGD